MSHDGPYSVRAVHCDHRATDEEVYRSLKRATAPLQSAWERLRQARRIVVKFNQAWVPERLRYHAGQLQELVSFSVARATLRLLRENTSAELACTEISVDKHDRDPDPGPTIILMPLLKEFGVSFVDGNLPPHKTYEVPGGGSMFARYLLAEGAMNGDAFVSVQKMKNHVHMGVTLCLKNLFGMPPQGPYGRARQYYHHIVRLPHVLADLGRLFHPTLNIVDALVCQAGREWNGEPRIGNALVAGDHVIATDACATYLMGHDPAADWPQMPFLRDRNALAIAASEGFGTVTVGQIDFQSEVQAPLAPFYTEQTDPPDIVAAWRRSACEQALFYRDHVRELIARYAGEFILLQDGQVVWHDRDSSLSRSRRDLAGDDKASTVWLKYVDPDEVEGEHLEVYEQELASIERGSETPAR